MLLHLTIFILLLPQPLRTFCLPLFIKKLLEKRKNKTKHKKHKSTETQNSKSKMRLVEAPEFVTAVGVAIAKKMVLLEYHDFLYTKPSHCLSPTMASRTPSPRTTLISTCIVIMQHTRWHRFIQWCKHCCINYHEIQCAPPLSANIEKSTYFNIQKPETRQGRRRKGGAKGWRRLWLSGWWYGGDGAVVMVVGLQPD